MLKRILAVSVNLLVVTFLCLSVGCSSSQSSLAPTNYTPTQTQRDWRIDQAQKIAQAMDSRNSVTRNYAVKLASDYPGEIVFVQAANIWLTVYGKWKYVQDPRGGDYYAKASETIQNGLAGDCDDFAIVLAALVESIGGRSRVVVANNAQSAHAYAEMFIGNKYEPTTSVITLALCVALKAVPSYDEEPNGDIWLNLDWSAKYPGGPFFPATNRLIVYPNGSFASA